jgi:hypothetical protein
MHAICDLFSGLLLVGAEFLVVVLADASILRQLTGVNLTGVPDLEVNIEEPDARERKL